MRGINFRKLTTLPTEAPTDHVRLYADGEALQLVDDEGNVLPLTGIPQEIPASPDAQDIADALIAAFPDVFTQAS